MAAHIRSAAVIGVEGLPVDVEADVGLGLPKFIIVGLPDTAVQEARERVRAAFRASGLPFPKSQITVNLAPADVRKEGPAYDLPIAISILEAEGVIPHLDNDGRVFIGELALDGRLRPVGGILPVATMTARIGCTTLFLPAENAVEAALIDSIVAYPLRTLTDVVKHLRGETMVAPASASTVSASSSSSGVDLADVRGQAQAKRALEIAAAGGHNILFSGPPGSGKTMLAKTMPSILPPMTRVETIEATTVHSVAGLLRGGLLVTSRPFRAPHHTASGVAVIGGGSWPRPGEVSLAHRGVLFLDEFPEFPRSVLENLRQPLEDGVITVSRANGTVRFPAKFILLAAMNPCPCGFATDDRQHCICTPSSVVRYRKKLSGPLMDRIDLHVEVPKMPFSEYLGTPKSETSAEVRVRVESARLRQHARFGDSGATLNTDMDAKLLRTHCRLDPAGDRMLRAAGERLGVSGRGYSRLLKVARTIADIDAAESIDEAHIAEAAMFRERKTAQV